MAGQAAGQVTLLLHQLKGGDQDALAQLMPLVYGELRRLAGHYMRGERPHHTLQPTALIHEVYLRLLGQSRIDWQSRSHFVAIAAQTMRRVLVDSALQRKARKRTTPANMAWLDQETPECALDEVLAIDDALARLATLDAEQARIVELRYFGGLTVDETAQALGVSPRTVRREWATAKLWLRAELSGSNTDDS
ncbi:MAG: sigma-70 family RNA polymerase sigma factor [Bryobacterales bacterium]|nr:sigma-70 family RNA polymerase sigma factor [Bryobacterales bacterium]